MAIRRRAPLRDARLALVPEQAAGNITHNSRKYIGLAVSRIIYARAWVLCARSNTAERNTSARASRSRNTDATPVRLL